MSHPSTRLDDVVHQRVRLGILSIAHESPRVEFGYLQRALDLTAGNLSRHLTALEQANLVTVEKGYEGRRHRTWVRITTAGRKAFRQEITELKTLIASVEQISATPHTPRTRPTATNQPVTG
jgi:DNA-binding MarR family transcriptional regulator